MTNRTRRSIYNAFMAPYPGLTLAEITERRHPKVTYISTSGMAYHADKYGPAPFLTKAYRRAQPKWKPGDKGMRCHAVDKEHDTDDYCNSICDPKWLEKGKEEPCDPVYCWCDDGTGKSKDGFVLDENGNVYRNEETIKATLTAEREQPSGLPECRWTPINGSGCKREEAYECIGGKMNGKCSEDNWFDVPDQCTHSCVHTGELNWSPHERPWYPGPCADEFQIEADADKPLPHYMHDPNKLTMEARGIDLSKEEVLMSSTCKKADANFIVISLWSPKFKSKAERQLRSCERNGVCCKSTHIPPDIFGANIKEGSDAFRFEIIASKPAFILSELEATRSPVVFADTDMEFHEYPKLFDSRLVGKEGGWPCCSLPDSNGQCTSAGVPMEGVGSRDLGVFNYWGNETDQFHGKSPSLGSGVMFINTTQRAVDVMIAWAEAMANDANAEAPDDQVLNKLLNEGAWLPRASFGYLPASYMRTMPWFYRGVSPVIDHDHGSSPGVAGHSEATPTLPQQLPPDEDGNAEKKANCLMHGICDADIQAEIDLENAERKWREDKAAGVAVGAEPNPPDPNEPLHFPKSGKSKAMEGKDPSTGAPIPQPAPEAPAVPEAPAAAPAAAEAPPAAQAAASGVKAGGKCKAVSDAASDEWCNGACNADTPLCPEDMCKCK
jgi:hypothetical protein